MGSKPQVEYGSVVVRDGIIGAFKVVRIYADKTADIQQFNYSTQMLIGVIYGRVPIAQLSVFETNKAD